MTWEWLTPPYRTIVADPPWDHADGTGTTLIDGKWVGSRLPYSVMSLDEIAALDVAGLSDGNAHLYLWTTNRYLRDAYDICDAWGFKVTKPLVWVKEPLGFFGRPFTSSAEFILCARQGSLSYLGNSDRQWWQWARGPHSRKPPAFMDIVEHVSPGPRVELFARQPRLGWDSWGFGFEGAA